MNVTEAADRVSFLTYKPGWTLYTLDAYIGAVLVGVKYDAPNSNREFAAAGYPETLHGIRTAFPIIMPDGVISEHEFYAQVMAGLLAIEHHEAREFLRDSSRNYAAPFHPHRDEGLTAYETVKSVTTNRAEFAMFPAEMIPG